MPRVLVEVADYAPDAAPYLDARMHIASGVYPRTEGGDGPLLGPVQADADALPSRVFGAFAARDMNGTNYVFAGTVNQLYQQSTGETTSTTAPLGSFVLGTSYLG
jgi:hypothetical protein